MLQVHLLLPTLDVKQFCRFPLGQGMPLALPLLTQLYSHDGSPLNASVMQKKLTSQDSLLKTFFQKLSQDSRQEEIRWYEREELSARSGAPPHQEVHSNSENACLGLSQAIALSHQQLRQGSPGEHLPMAPTVPSHGQAQQRHQLSHGKEVDQLQDGRPLHQENRDHYGHRLFHHAIALGSYIMACQATCRSVSVPNYHAELSLTQSQLL